MNVIVPVELFMSEDISNSGKVLYVNLLGLSEEVNYFKMSESDIAEKFNTSARQLRRGLSELINEGLVISYRENIKDINSYIIIPYEIREKGIVVDSLEGFEEVLKKVKSFVDISIKGKKKRVREGASEPIKVIEDIDKKISEGSKLNLYDFGAYFFKLNFERNGYITKFKGTKYLSILKRISSGRTEKEVLKIIKVFLTIYDDKFKKEGFETPTIESLGTTWIFNIVLGYCSNFEDGISGDEEMSGEVF